MRMTMKVTHFSQKGAEHTVCGEEATALVNMVYPFSFPSLLQCTSGSINKTEGAP